MRILINGVSARAGGGVAYLRKLLELLPGAMPEAHFLAAVPEIKFFKGLKEQGNLEIYTVKEASSDFFRRYLWENTELIKLCQSWQADLLFCVANIVPLIRPGIPVVLMVQNVAPLTPRVIKMKWRYESANATLQILAQKWLSLFSLGRADRVISLSYATSRLLKRFKPEIDSDVLYHGISAEFNPCRPRPFAVGDRPYFIYVSNLYVYKGLEYLVEALEHDKALPDVFVAGKSYDVAYVAYIKRLADSAGVAARIKFLDNIPREELPGFYANAVAMVYPSWCENCPNILLESMACGCPVVAMKIGPMPEICADAAFYARPFSGKSLAEAMQQAILQTGNAKVRERAIARAADFTWEESMRLHRQIFNAVKK